MNIANGGRIMKQASKRNRTWGKCLVCGAHSYYLDSDRVCPDCHMDYRAITHPRQTAPAAPDPQGATRKALRDFNKFKIGLGK